MYDRYGKSVVIVSNSTLSVAGHSRVASADWLHSGSNS